MADNIPSCAVTTADIATALNTVTTAITRSSKRKRAQVSYLDQDEELDKLLGGDDEGYASQGSELDIDDDTTYGSSKVRLTRLALHSLH